MKKTVFVLLSFYVLCSCTSPSQQPKLINETITQQTDRVLNNWHLAASEADFENYFNAMDTLAVFIGTDAGENWKKSEFQKFCKPYFDQGKAWDFKVLERNNYVSFDRKIVWFDELLDTWMGPCRGSGVLELQNNTWKIKHYVLSLTIPNDDIQEVMKVTKKKNAAFMDTIRSKKN